MKTVIAAINSRFIHSSLAAWYLKANCSELCGQVEVAEYTINDITDYILMSLYAKHADVLAFSCYIWNMETVLKLADTVKKVSPGIKIILGGPEVSYESVMMLEKYSFIDFILAGEGEQSLDLLLQYLNENYQGLDEIEGLFYKEEGMLIKGKGGFALVKNLDSLKTPYTEQMLASLDNRIMYYESSRGCPFSCSYCISSTFEGVRYFAMEKVKNQLKCFISRGIPQVKFVDRTFNCHKERAKEIFRFIIDNAASTAFHFEVAADLFDDEMFKILSKAPVGLIQFEIGVQTTNSDCLTAIDRKTDLSSVFKNTAKLIEKGKFHIHLDLIAGLPREDYESFKKSFDEVYRLSPNNLQLGFLKMLKGSRIRKEASEYGYKFREYPPYEVLENKYLSFDSVCELKSIEEVVERYYNKGRFIKTLLYITSGFFSSAFEFYRSFAQYNIKNGYLERPLA
ncbi:MAG: radical SAM protein, partial [Bacillota bacterium]|nr:radical SAM protein [Bacillota bacterium]